METVSDSTTPSGGSTAALDSHPDPETTMKAMVQDTYGSSEVLELRNIDKPEIGGDDVLVRVRAAAVNPADWAIVRGLPYIARPLYGLRKPKNGTRGTDVAGEVEAVGPGVTRFQPGDAVFGWCQDLGGAFAEYASISEDALTPKPANLTFEQAAAVPTAGLVALEALRNVRAGQTVLVNGASGGIGTFAVQIAKSLGAEVTGVCSTSNVDLVRSIGSSTTPERTSRGRGSDTTSSWTMSETTRCPTSEARSARRERSCRTVGGSKIGGSQAVVAFSARRC